MNDALRMQLSAFVDGELPENEAELFLRRLSQDAALRQQVASYLEIGRLIRQEREVPGMDGLRGRIAAALGDEPVSAPEEEPVVGSRLMTPTTGVAVAATVAAVALLGLSQFGAQVDPGLGQALAIDDGPSAYTEPTVEQVLGEQPSELWLRYYQSHGESAPGLGPDRILPLPATLEVSEELVETDPDPRLVSGDDESLDVGDADDNP